jgi:type I pantothenate kinase
VSSQGAFDELVALVAHRTRDKEPVLVGIGGGVAVGKSTAAAALVANLQAGGVAAAVVATDCFLLPNAVLAERGILMQKGFPGTFDDTLLDATLTTIRSGAPVDLPVYSHAVYDRLVDETVRLEPTAVVVLDGVNVLLAPIVDHLTIAVYIDAAESDVERWYHRRFEDFCQAAADDDRSFYRPLAVLEYAQRHAIADAAWTGINLVNLHEHIAPSRRRADWVLEKGPDHAYRRLRPITPGPRPAPTP